MTYFFVQLYSRRGPYRKNESSLQREAGRSNVQVERLLSNLHLRTKKLDRDVRRSTLQRPFDVGCQTRAVPCVLRYMKTAQPGTKELDTLPIVPPRKLVCFHG